ncbi:MAG: BatA domain-containing protein [Bacteroidota bacterium]
MIFLNPGFLYALLALTIPIIIHLFNFRRTKKVYFSNTLFLKKVKEASSSKRRLKHYLILASRLLFLFFLVMAFCQPFLPSESNLATSNKNIIYLDNSWSMSNEVDQDLNGLDAAVLYVQSLLDAYPDEAEYKLITNDFSSFSNSFKGKTEIGDFLTEIKYSGSSRNVHEIEERIKAELTSEVNDVFWISDFQNSLLKSRVAFDSTINMNLIPLFFNSIENVHVDSVYLNSPFLIGDSRPRITAVISNTGLAEVNDLVVKVVLNDTEVATGTVSIQSNDMTEIGFDLSLDLEQINKGKITLEEFPVTFDNEFYFTLSTTRKINILEIKNQSEVTPVEVVYANQDIFEFSSFQTDNLDYSFIEKSDLIILNSINEIEPSLVSPLNNYLDAGGSILLVPAYRADVLSYRQLRGLNSLSLLDTARHVALAAPDFNNPFFTNVFEENSPAIAMPKVTNTLTWGGDRSAILSTQAGVPYLSEIKRTGSVYLLGSPLNRDFGSFQDHALFVPVMYRMAIYGAKGDIKLYQYINTEVVTYPILNDQVEAIVKLKGQEELIPSYRFDADGLMLQVPKYLLNAGFYDLEINNELKGALAYNYAAKESNLRQEQEPAAYFSGNVDVLSSSSNEEFRAQIENKYKGAPLWKYAICLALLFLFCEVLLIRFLT